MTTKQAQKQIIKRSVSIALILFILTTLSLLSQIKL